MFSLHNPHNENTKMKTMFIKNNFHEFDLFEHNIESPYTLMHESLEKEIKTSYFINSEEIFINNLLFIQYSDLSKFIYY